jgi:hypothetical protein
MAVLSKNGYGQVEPNHLTAQRTGQIYAQLPVEAETLADLVTPGIVQNGMFLDYDYAKNSVVAPALGGSNLTMLVMNEIRTYADFLTPKDYAQIATGTTAGIGLSNEAPVLYKSATLATIAQNGATGVITLTVTAATSNSLTTGSIISLSGLVTASGNSLTSLNGTYTIATNGGVTSTINTSGTTTISTSTTASNIIVYAAGTASFNTVYPRLYKINVGDIITTNLVDSTNGLISDFAIGDILVPGTNGVLVKSTFSTASVVFKVAGITTTPDLQSAVKLQCINAS